MDEEEKVRVLLGGETDTTDEAGRIDKGVKKYLRKVMDKRRIEVDGEWSMTMNVSIVHACVCTRAMAL